MQEVQDNESERRNTCLIEEIFDEVYKDFEEPSEDEETNHGLLPARYDFWLYVVYNWSHNYRVAEQDDDVSHMWRSACASPYRQITKWYATSDIEKTHCPMNGSLLSLAFFFGHAAMAE